MATTPLLRRLHEYAEWRERRKPKPARIDVAICVPDMKTARRIKNNTAVITPANWKGEAVLHVLVGNETDIPNELRVLLASLRFVDHKQLDVIYPYEMEIGWQQETLPQNQRSSSTQGASSSHRTSGDPPHKSDEEQDTST